MNGRLLPLYFQVTGVYWATPVSIYVTALLLKFVPLTETAVRTPAAFIGALNVALVYLLMLRISRSRGEAILAAALLALTPAHLIHSRMGGDLIYPVPFLLTALIGVVEYFERRDRRFLFAAGIVLGLGCYSYLGAVTAMPLCLLAVAAAIVAFDDRPLRAIAAVVAGFLLPLLPLIPWLAAHPEQIGGQVDSNGDPTRTARESE